jgi:DNA-binding response OmpR family regulator
VTADDGELALKLFVESPDTIHLVISDVVMPGLLGPQLLRSIRNLSPSTPALLMSGTWTTEPEDGVALIGKPFTRQKLVARAKDLLDACDFAKIEREQSIARSPRLVATPEAVSPQPESPKDPPPGSKRLNAMSLVPDFTKMI